MRRIESLYKRQGDSFLIEIKLSALRQFFNSLDPAPFLERDLDDEAEAYIVDSVREFPHQTPLRLVLYLPQADLDTARAALPEAVQHYFDYRAQVAQRELRHILRDGRTSLVIGLALLLACMMAREVVGNLSSPTLTGFLDEGLLICGWVAMWRPIQIFLYDWWPIRRRRRILEKARDLPIEVRLTPTVVSMLETPDAPR